MIYPQLDRLKDINKKLQEENKVFKKVKFLFIVFFGLLLVYVSFPNLIYTYKILILFILLLLTLGFAYYFRIYIEIRVNDKDYVIYLLLNIINKLEKSEKNPLTEENIENIEKDFNNLNKRLLLFKPLYLQYGFDTQAKINKFLTIFTIAIKKYFITNFSDHKKYYEIKNLLESLVEIVVNEKFDRGIELLETKVKEVKKYITFFIKLQPYINTKWFKISGFTLFVVLASTATWYISKKQGLTFTEIQNNIVIVLMIIGLVWGIITYHSARGKHVKE